MDKIINGILKFLAILCAILFVLTAGIAIMLFNAEKRLFDASLYINALESQDFYDRLPELTAENLATSPDSNDPNSPRTYLNLIPAEYWETAFRALLPPDVSRPMTEQVIQSMFDYLNGKSETASLSFVGFKTHLTGPAGSESLLAILRAQPACSLEQITQLIIGNLFGQKTGLVFCNPSDEMLDIFQPLLQTQLETMASTIPDSVDLTPDSAGTDHPLDGLRVARTLMRFSPLIPLGFLFLITTLAVRNLKSWLNWWGYPVMFAGILGLLLSAIINPFFQWAFVIYITPRLPDFLSVTVIDTIHGLISAVLSGVAAPILLQATILALIGVVMIIATHIKKSDGSTLEMVEEL